MNKYFELLNYSEYSLGLGNLSINEMIDYACEKNIEVLGICDENTISGAYDFEEQCKKNNIKPMIGCTLNIFNKGKDLGKIIVFAKNNKGLQEINKVLESKFSLEESEGLHKEFVKIEDLLNLTSENTFLVDGFKNSLFQNNKNYNKIYKNLENSDIKYAFNNDETDDFKKRLKSWVKTNNLKIFPSKTNRYLDNTINDKSLLINKSRNFSYLKNLDLKISEIKELFSGNESLFKNQDYIKLFNKSSSHTFDIDDILEMETISYPKNAKIEKIFNYDLSDIVRKMWPSFSKKLKEEDKPKYVERIKKELDIIYAETENGKLDYSDYFIFMCFYKKTADDLDLIYNVRGSGAASLIVHMLGLTDIDPVENDLLFERFLSLFRNENPDIDLDISDSKKLQKEVGKRLREKNTQITNLVNFNSLQSVKSTFEFVIESLRNFNDHKSNNIISEALDIFYKLYPHDEPLSEKLKNNEDWKKYYNENKSFKTISDLALKIEGKFTYKSSNTASVFITKEDFSNHTPIFKSDLGSGYTSELSKHSNIYLKYDLLESIQLKTIKNIIDVIDFKNIFKNIKYEDDNVFKMLSQGYTSGIMQLSQYAGTELSKMLSINKFQDIVTVNALIRDFKNVSESEEIKQLISNKDYYKPENKLQEILSKTYGMFIFEEQILRICTEISDLSFEDADKIRSLVKKKNTDDIEKYEKKFIKGCLKNGYNKEDSNFIFNQIKNKKYTFNEAHAASYADIIYKQAFLKYNYPGEFLTEAIKSIAKDKNAYKKAKHIKRTKGLKDTLEDIKYKNVLRSNIDKILEEYKNMNIVIRRPSINESELYNRTAIATYKGNEIKTIIPSLIENRLINHSDKNISTKTLSLEMMDLIIKERKKVSEDGKPTHFLDLLDFTERVLPLYTGIDSNGNPEKEKISEFIENTKNLIEIGAFDDLAPESIKNNIPVARSSLYKNLENIVFIALNPDLEDFELDLDFKIYEADKTLKYYEEKEIQYLGFSPNSYRKGLVNQKKIKRYP